MTGTRTRTRAAHLGPEKRRPLVLDAARTVYLAHGYDGASMDAIAATAGVTKPVLYDCYANKQVLFTELLRRETELLLHAAAASLPSTIDMEHPAETLRNGMQAFLRGVAAHPQSFTTVRRAVVEGRAADLAQGLDDHRQLMLSRIRELVQTWLMLQSADDVERRAEIASHAVFAIGEAFAQLLTDQPHTFDPDALATTASLLLLQGFEGVTGLRVPE